MVGLLLISGTAGYLCGYVSGKSAEIKQWHREVGPEFDRMKREKQEQQDYLRMYKSKLRRMQRKNK